MSTEVIPKSRLHKAARAIASASRGAALKISLRTAPHGHRLVAAGEAGARLLLKASGPIIGSALLVAFILSAASLGETYTSYRARTGSSAAAILATRASIEVSVERARENAATALLSVHAALEELSGKLSVRIRAYGEDLRHDAALTEEQLRSLSASALRFIIDASHR